MTDKKITKIEDLKKFTDGEIVELPSFDENTPFSAKLKRPSLLMLCIAGEIPNELLGVAQELFEGKQKTDIKKYAEVLNVIINAALVEPLYEDVKDILTDMQRMAIFSYTQNGIKGLLPFRALENISKADNIIKK